MSNKKPTITTARAASVPPPKPRPTHATRNEALPGLLDLERYLRSPDAQLADLAQLTALASLRRGLGQPISETTYARLRRVVAAHCAVDPAPEKQPVWRSFASKRAASRWLRDEDFRFMLATGRWYDADGREGFIQRSPIAPRTWYACIEAEMED